MTKFPKVIHTLWYQGANKAPAWVQANFDHTQALNNGYAFVVHDQASVQETLIGKGFSLPRDITVQALSDLFRVTLLAEKGGIWMDASVYHARPLDDWLTPQMDQADFFAFAFKDRDAHPIASWFLASKEGAGLATGWLETCKAYWREDMVALTKEESTGDAYRDPIAAMGLDQDQPNNAYPYFWFHYLFGHMVQYRPEQLAYWQETAKLPAENAHLLQKLLKKRAKAQNRPLKRFQQMLRPLPLSQAMAGSPVHKLDWRMDIAFDALETLRRG